jgi:2-C-methyl-D-erythritol 4-phosphate cytidylyltransferase
MSGAERHYSSLSAIKAYENEEECNLIFHDAVRPLISSQIIDRVIVALQNYEAIDVAIPRPIRLYRLIVTIQLWGFPPSNVKERANSSRIPFEYNKNRL